MRYSCSTQLVRFAAYSKQKLKGDVRMTMKVADKKSFTKEIGKKGSFSEFKAGQFSHVNSQACKCKHVNVIHCPEDIT